MAEALFTASTSLINFIRLGLEKNFDCERIARVGTILIGKQSISNDSMFLELADYLCDKEHKNNGWVDVEETTWSIAYLHKMPGEYKDAFNRGLKWLVSQRLPDSGWGRNNRDVPRIPYTSWVAILVPELIDDDVLLWLEKACLEELKSEPKLSYKLALPLSAFSKHNYYPQVPELISSLTSCLISSQNDDGGFWPMA